MAFDDLLKLVPMLGRLGNAFTASGTTGGGVGQAAANVGNETPAGRSILGRIPGLTTNARSMTSFLSGGTGNAGMAHQGTTGGGEGADLSEKTITRLAKAIADATGSKRTGSNMWQPKTPEFKDEAKQPATGPRGVVERIQNSFANLSGRMTGGILGKTAPETASEQPEVPPPIVNQKLPSWLQAATGQTQQATRTAKELKTGDVAASLGAGSKGGWSQVIAPPPAAAALKATAAVSEGGGFAAGLGAMAGMAMKGAFAIGGVAMAAVGVVTSLIGATKALGAFAESTMEGYREISRYNGGIAMMMAGLDRQKLVLGARYAAATSGSAGAMGSNVQSFREAWQPVSEAMGTFRNVAAIGAAKLGGLLATLLAPLKQMADFCEWLVGKGPEQVRPFPMILGGLADGKLHRTPRNVRPGDFSGGGEGGDF